MASSCPPNAPAGSKWTIHLGRFACVAPDGSVVPTGDTPVNPVNLGGGPGGGGLLPPNATPGNSFTSVPNFTLGGGSGPNAGGGSGLTKYIPSLLELGGGILNAVGSHKQAANQQQSAVDTWNQKEQNRISRVKLILGIARGLGLKGMESITPAMFDEILKPRPYTGGDPTVGSVFTGVGGALQTLAPYFVPQPSIAGATPTRGAAGGSVSGSGTGMTPDPNAGPGPQPTITKQPWTFVNPDPLDYFNWPNK